MHETSGSIFIPQGQERKTPLSREESHQTHMEQHFKNLTLPHNTLKPFLVLSATYRHLLEASYAHGDSDDMEQLVKQE